MPTKKIAPALLAAGILIQCAIIFRLVRVLISPELQSRSDTPATVYAAFSLVGMFIAIAGARLLRKKI